MKQNIGDYESKVEEVNEEKRNLERKLEEVQRSLGLEATFAKNKRDSLQRQLSEAIKQKEELQASLEAGEDNIQRLETRCGHLSKYVDTLKKKKSQSTGASPMIYDRYNKISRLGEGGGEKTLRIRALDIVGH